MKTLIIIFCEITEINLISLRERISSDITMMREILNELVKLVVDG